MNLRIIYSTGVGSYLAHVFTNHNFTTLTKNHPFPCTIKNKVLHFAKKAIQQNPYGMLINGVSTINYQLSTMHSLYNGKELQQQTQFYDYGFRQQDPQLGRWHSVDKLAESFHSESPYSYAGNNPINQIDLLGLARTYNYNSGQWEGTRGYETFGFAGNWDNPDLPGSPVPIGGSGVFEAGPTFEETNFWGGSSIDYKEIEKLQTVEEIVEYLMNNTHVEEGSDLAVSHINFELGFAFLNLQITIPESTNQYLARGDKNAPLLPVGIGFYRGIAASTTMLATTHNAEVGFVIILAGKHAGKVLVQFDYGIGVSGPAFDQSLEVQLYFLNQEYSGAHRHLESTHFEGNRTEAGFSYGPWGITGMRSEKLFSSGGVYIGRIWGFGPEVSSGLTGFTGPFPIDININHGETFNWWNYEK